MNLSRITGGLFVRKARPFPTTKEAVRPSLHRGGRRVGSAFALLTHDRFACPACLKPFKHQKVIAIKECGHVMCADCFKKFVGTSKQCFVCQSPVVKKKDFIQMETGGTGFSSHNKVDVKVYVPTEN